MDAVTLLAMLGPVAVDLGKTLIGRYFGGFQPTNIAEFEAVQRLDIEKFKALNDAGGVNPSYAWVESVIRLQRPAVGAVVLLTWCYSRLAGVPSDAVDNFAAAIGFYLFGDRTLFYVRGKK